MHHRTPQVSQPFGYVVTRDKKRPVKFLSMQSANVGLPWYIWNPGQTENRSNLMQNKICKVSPHLHLYVQFYRCTLPHSFPLFASRCILKCYKFIVAIQTLSSLHDRSCRYVNFCCYVLPTMAIIIILKALLLILWHTVFDRLSISPCMFYVAL